MGDDLSSAGKLDFSSLPLDYEKFRQLARNPNLSEEEKIAFPPELRRGYEDGIFADILRKLPALESERRSVVDIGSGVGGLTTRLIAQCRRQAHRLVLVDSEEMLALTPESPEVIKVPGMYPSNAEAVRQAAGGSADAVLCYSVLHYVFVDTNPFAFLDSIMGILNDGGAALVGDIPNASKRRRFFSSATGVAFHKQNRNTDAPPLVSHFDIQHENIDDAVMSGLVTRAQAAGFDAYVLPQAADLPMANRRDDLLIRKP